MTTTSISAAETGLATLAFARGMCTRLLEGIPDAKWTFIPHAGCNHALWIMGHTAGTDDYFRVTLGEGQERVNPESWGELFGMESEPNPDASAYPSVDEVRRVWTEARERFNAWYGGLTDDQLAEPLPEKLQPFAKNLAVLAGTMAVHEAMHAGQLSIIRRQLDLPRSFG